MKVTTTTASRRIAIVGHEATRSGAPILLREVTEACASVPEWDVSVVLREGGEILEEYEARAQTTVIDRGAPGSSRLVRKMRRVLRQDSSSAAADRAARHAGPVDLAYVNTSLLGHYAAAFKARGARVVTHVHELGEFIDRRVPSAALHAMVRSTDTFIVVSEAVSRDLISVGVLPERIQLVRGAVAMPPEPQNTFLRDIRRGLGIPAEGLVVGCVGGRTWAKGPDIFVQVARRVHETIGGSMPVTFLWLGGSDEGEFSHHLRYEIERTKLNGRVKFVPAVPDPSQWYYLFDVYALTSRADSFPLAMLEAAARSTPIVAFDSAGGAPEFIRNDAGRVVPFLATASMADAVLDLLRDVEARSLAGAAAARRVHSEHLMPEMLEKIIRVIRSEVEAST